MRMSGSSWSEFGCRFGRGFGCRCAPAHSASDPEVCELYESVSSASEQLLAL